ncbi:MAG: hypothetical protein JO304_27950 [Solirubrobacterales bacterium]|nr:hypothetical protein [Solirubrobacterales bacterium]
MPAWRPGTGSVRVRGKQLCPTVRPGFFWLKANCTVAALSSVNLNVVPTGGRRARLITASRPPARHLPADWLTLEIEAAVAGGAAVAGKAAVAGPPAEAGGAGQGDCRDGSVGHWSWEMSPKPSPSRSGSIVAAMSARKSEPGVGVKAVVCPSGTSTLSNKSCWAPRTKSPHQPELESE